MIRIMLSLCAGTVLLATGSYPPEPPAAPPQPLRQVRPVDPQTSPDEERLAALEAKIDKVLEISQRNLDETRKITNSIDSLKVSNNENAIMIVEAIKGLKEPAVASAVKTVQEPTPLYETRWVQICDENGCRWVQETVEVRDGVQPAPPSDPPGDFPAPGPPPPGDGGGGGCGQRLGLFAKFLRNTAIRRANAGRPAIFPRIRSLFVR